MHRKNIVYEGFGTVCSFRHPLGALECVSTGKGALLYLVM